MRPCLLPLVLGLPAWLGCSDPSGPPRYNLQISESTVGVDQDNLYAIRIDRERSTPMRTGLALALVPGEHDVVLEDLAPNCSAQGPDSVRVTVTSDEVAEVEFQVACVAVTGAIQVWAPASGRDFDPDGYRVRLDDSIETRVFPRGGIVIEGVGPGSHTVSLDDVSANCDLVGPASRTVEVRVGGLTRDTVRLTFEGSCEAITGDVQLLTTTRGVHLDLDGYTVLADGMLLILPCGYWDYGCTPGAPLTLVPNGSNMLVGVLAGEHEYKLDDIAPNCTAAGGEVRRVTVEPGELAVVRFDLTCNDV